jgi:glycyl-tRNA synthetase alpha subunit
VDGGATAVQRYQSGVSNPSDCLDTLVDAVWDEPANDHLVAGSFGEKLNQNNAAAQTLIMAMSDVQNLVRLLLKYETNRTRIDHVAKTLTVYDDDGTTILRVFNLLDGNGVGSVDEVCERTPTSATDGLPVLP